MNVLAIDQGTTSTKALVIGPGQYPLAGAEVGLRRRDLPGGGVGQRLAAGIGAILVRGHAAQSATLPPG
jgi:hypothetical protein